ncbi:MAG TPA: ATP-binding protein [Vicinamibacterales bacterium]|nr:ATP-binding protein [Vicinamibacterales bacterium]
MLFRTLSPGARPPAEPRKRPLDNPRVLLAAAVVLIALLGGLFWLSESTTQMSLPVLADVLLYALVGVDIALILALLFVLARNLLKLWVEQRQAAPFARFRAKLVAALLAMTIVPAVLVLMSGSEIISNSAARWFSEPVPDIIGAAQFIASRYYLERKDAIQLRAGRLARTLPAAAVADQDVAALGPMLDAELATLRDGMVELYGVALDATGTPAASLLVAKEAESLPRDHVRASADRLATQAITSGRDESTQDPLDSGGVLVRTAGPILGPDGAVVGAVVVSQHLGSDVRAQALVATDAYQRYQALQVLKGPIQGVYLSIFLAVTLLILIGATWMGLYLAKRITRPVQMLAEGARAIGAGQLDFRLEPETSDELGSLVEAFNMMAAELRTSREKLDQSRLDLERTNIEVEARRRYIETILERAATGVISLDAEGRISTVNGAAERLLGLDEAAIDVPALAVFAREDLRPLLPLVEATEAAGADRLVQEIMLARDDRELHLAATATVLTGDAGRREGAVLVLDDVTPLIRAQRVAAWRDVARRLAHEIKNPLTPIQLSADRLRRHFAGAPRATQALVHECTDAIIVEVEALKGLVDEFAQFARLRGPRMVPADLNRLVDDALRLYAGVLQHGQIRIERDLAPDLPPVRFDAEQIRQVIINLVDNALEALGGPAAPARPDGGVPTIRVTTAHDLASGLVRLTVTDNGPGVPPADRDKLFMPYYSTKGRGSGLGLAIVRRIVVEHGGAIEAGEARPTGTAFTVELPAA